MREKKLKFFKNYFLVEIVVFTSDGYYMTTIMAVSRLDITFQFPRKQVSPP